MFTAKTGQLRTLL